MAMLTPPEANGRLVLDIYAHFRSRPGDVLGSRNFLAVATRRHVKVSDLQKGLDYAVGIGWLEETPEGSLRLTDRGFANMPPSA